MKPLAYKHYFNVIDGKYVWENLDMFNLIKRTLEGKRGYAIIEEETESMSTNQLAFYFGGIILIELRGTMRTIHRPGGGTSIAEMPGDFDDIMRSKKKMAGYLEDVIAHLQLEFDIYVKPSEHYKANGYIVKTKHYGIAKES
jgi:hypothetical protein